MITLGGAFRTEPKPHTLSLVLFGALVVFVPKSFGDSDCAKFSSRMRFILDLVFPLIQHSRFEVSPTDN